MCSWDGPFHKPHEPVTEFQRLISDWPDTRIPPLHGDDLRIPIGETLDWIDIRLEVQWVATLDLRIPDLEVGNTVAAGQGCNGRLPLSLVVDLRFSWYQVVLGVDDLTECHPDPAF